MRDDNTGTYRYLSDVFLQWDALRAISVIVAEPDASFHPNGTGAYLGKYAHVSTSQCGFSHAALMTTLRMQTTLPTTYSNI